jgi:hypothetical protein
LLQRTKSCAAIVVCRYVPPAAGFAIGNVAAFDMSNEEAVVSPGGVGVRAFLQLKQMLLYVMSAMLHFKLQPKLHSVLSLA